MGDQPQRQAGIVACTYKYKPGDVVRVSHHVRYSKKLLRAMARRQHKIAIVLDVAEPRFMTQHVDGKISEISYHVYNVLVGLDRVEISEEDLVPA